MNSPDVDYWIRQSCNFNLIKQSPEQNKELNRRIAVHIVTVCEELFNHYTKKAQGMMDDKGGGGR